MSFPIGVFDSGYGGLTVLKSIQAALPQHDFLYFGDNARAPYGTKTFDEIYQYTRECVAFLFSQGCPLVILACNTASARALRNIQQRDLMHIQRHSSQRVLGVIRPTAETIGTFTKSRHIGILGTQGTVKSQSYCLEIKKFSPDIQVHQHACPTWVDYIEAGQYNTPYAIANIEDDVRHLLATHRDIDCVLLACTHYPFVAHHVRAFLPEHITLIQQSDIVAEKTTDYLLRHPEIAKNCAQNAVIKLLTTGNVYDFENNAMWLYSKTPHIEQVNVR